jgi:hypothetical protein
MTKLKSTGSESMEPFAGMSFIHYIQLTEFGKHFYSSRIFDHFIFAIPDPFVRLITRLIYLFRDRSNLVPGANVFYGYLSAVSP